MILVRFTEPPQHDTPQWGILENGTIEALDAPPYDAVVRSGRRVTADTARLLPPCEPTSIVAVGKNYADHIAELDSAMPDEPTIFFKPLTSLNAPDADIPLPPKSLSRRVDYEGELALVIRKQSRNVTPEQALDHVLGYTCLNDVTARDLQRKDGQWARAKGFDGFGPVGPVLSDELDPLNAHIETRVNGKTVQKSNTSMMLWDVRYLVSFVSRFMTLRPGDILTTGTPEGVGPLHDGDVVEVEVEGIGVLRNRAVRAPSDPE